MGANCSGPRFFVPVLSDYMGFVIQLRMHKHMLEEWAPITAYYTPLFLEIFSPLLFRCESTTTRVSVGRNTLSG